MNINRSAYRFIILLLCLAVPSLAQDAPPQPSARDIKRYEIDAKRIGVDPNSEDALPRSREFKRIDSTYYVGWFFEGTYKYNHAADYNGYRNASLPLERALSLMERDYRRELATRSSELMVFYPTFRFKFDYSLIVYYLVQCYSNMDDPVKVFHLLTRIKKWNFQYDAVMDVYNWFGWTVHRNRFYTSDKYFFLKNSIAENEALANRYLDSGLLRIERNRAINSRILQPGYDRQEKLAVYHYKSILHSYALNIDSASHYYGLMRGSPAFPHNNFATFRSVCGDFRTAEAEYRLAAAQESGDKRLKEYVYYTSILNIYKGLPKTGQQLLKDMIQANGSTPGFGWYNIALARCMYYDGQIAESERYIKKASEFKELHIGTTLGQSHYEFSAQLNKLMNTEARWEMQRFEHDNWWYNLPVLSEMARLLGEKYMQQFLIINQFAQNPERDKVVYKLFSTESTVTWDEIWHLVKDFSTRFFIKRFENELKKDDRRYILKYYKLFVAKLKMQQGNHKEARQLLDELLHEPNTDLEYEKLFVARAFEAQARCARELGREDDYQDWMYRLYNTYPQLVPYTGLKMNMSLQVMGDEDKDVTRRLKDCRINWVNTAGSVKAYVIYSKKGDKKNIGYYVMDGRGNLVVDRQGFSYQDAEQAGVMLAYRLFNIGGKDSKTGTAPGI